MGWALILTPAHRSSVSSSSVPQCRSCSSRAVPPHRGVPHSPLSILTHAAPAAAAREPCRSFGAASLCRVVLPRTPPPSLALGWERGRGMTARNLSLPPTCPPGNGVNRSSLALVFALGYLVQAQPETKPFTAITQQTLAFGSTLARCKREPCRSLAA